MNRFSIGLVALISMFVLVAGSAWAGDRFTLTAGPFSLWTQWSSAWGEPEREMESVQEWDRHTTFGCCPCCHPAVTTDCPIEPVDCSPVDNAKLANEALKLRSMSGGSGFVDLDGFTDLDPPYLPASRDSKTIIVPPTPPAPPLPDPPVEPNGDTT